MNNNKLPVMTTVKDASVRTGLPEYYLRKLCITGQIKAVKNGKKYYINQDSLCEFLSSEKGIADEEIVESITD